MLNPMAMHELIDILKEEINKVANNFDWLLAIKVLLSQKDILHTTFGKTSFSITV